MQSEGWHKPVTNGACAGTLEKKLRLEGIIINVLFPPVPGKIVYRAHVQNIGWMNWVNSGELAGTTGRSLRMEALEIKIEGELSKMFDIYYRVFCDGLGWQNWHWNGETAGTTGQGRRTEMVQIFVWPKGSKPTFFPDPL